MFRYIQISALAVAAFIGYVLPLVLSWFLMTRLYSAVATKDAELGRGYFWLLLAVNIFGSVMGGYVAARLSKFQPLLHGMLSGIVGGILMGAFREFNIAWSFYYVVAGIVGGWLWHRGLGAIK
jgi:hypothetical protein